MTEAHVPPYVPPQEAGRTFRLGCLPVGAAVLLVAVLVMVAAARSCASTKRVVVPQRVSIIDLQACMTARGFVGTVENERLVFRDGDGRGSGFERALVQCDELGARSGPDLQLQECMKREGWSSTIVGERLHFEVENRRTVDFEHALGRCEKQAGDGDR